MTIEMADKLVALRKAKGFSQQEAAEKLGVSRQAVSRWEQGETSPDTDNLIKLFKDCVFNHFLYSGFIISTSS